MGDSTPPHMRAINYMEKNMKAKLKKDAVLNSQEFEAGVCAAQKVVSVHVDLLMKFVTKENWKLLTNLEVALDNLRNYSKYEY